MLAKSIALVGCVLAGATLAKASSDAVEIARGRSAGSGQRFAYLDGPTWYAIAGSFSSRGSAERRARELGGRWYAQQTNVCANYSPGLWIVAAGFFSRGQAQSYASSVGGYAKECL